MHCCCAPCASSVLEKLSSDFQITALFYNPNIMPREEYFKRAEEFQKLPLPEGYPHRIDSVVCEYDPGPFIAAAAPFPDEPEGGARCRACFKLRLEETAKRASEGLFDAFATTLSVSPHKNAADINAAGGFLENEYGVEYLYSDFKKQDGYKRSIELSKRYGLYRQTYCGCASSRTATKPGGSGNGNRVF